MATDAKQFIRPEDIRTMQKDIGQIKKLGAKFKPKQEIRISAEIPKKEIPGEALKEQIAKKDAAKEKEILDRILGETAEQRHANEQPNMKIAKNEPAISKPSEGAEIKDKTQTQQLKPAVNQGSPTEPRQARPWETKKEAQIKAAAPENKEWPKPILENGDERKKKFLEDIERWANSN